MRNQGRNNVKTLRRLIILSLCVSLSGLGAAADGQTLGYTIDDGELVLFDLETLDFSTIAPTGMSLDVGGLPMAGDGSLWAVDFFGNDLWRIDPSTGTASHVGPFGVDITVYSGLAFDACGDLWLVTDALLYQVDPMSGNATLVADFGGTAFVKIMALTARANELFALFKTGYPSQLAKIDPHAGTIEIFGDEVYLATGQQGLDFDSRGRLWGNFYIDHGGIPSPWHDSIIQFDPDTGR